MAARVLIVDDDPVQRRLLDNMVRKFGHEPVIAESGEQAAAMLAGGERFDCVVLDLVMPDLDGFGVLARMRTAGLTVPVIVQTAHGGIDNAVSAMRAGAADFVVKPVGAERLQVSLANALERSLLADELARTKRAQSGTLTFRDIVTHSSKMQAVLRNAEKAAASAIPVLIEGESGVGKELIARAIHGQSERRARPFVAVNCGAIPENLVESTLFGHEKGSFTGATEKHNGKFLEASGGTLFLDEVGELPMAAQVKLLRAIQEGEVEPVGGRKPVKVDVRIISATNRNLTDDVRHGRFREDLFYRLHVFPIAVPPLRERSEDIPDSGASFPRAVRRRRGQARARDQRRGAGAARPPPLAGQRPAARERRVPRRGAGRRRHHRHGRVPAGRGADRAGALRTAVFRTAAHCIRTGDGRSRAARRPWQAATIHGALALLDGHGDVRPLEEIEYETIRFAIAHYRGQMSEVARRLRIGRSTLYRKLEHLGLGEQPKEPA